jgi:hypothetical protein
VTAALAIAAGATPALAGPTTSSTGAATASTPLTAQIAKWTPQLKLRYGGPGPTYKPNATTGTFAAIDISRVPADAAQLPSKLEFVLGARVLRRADYQSYDAVLARGRRHTAAGKRDLAEAHAGYRLSNYFLAGADSKLGVPHPEYFAAPFQPVKGKPLDTSTPLIASAPKPTLTAMISMGTPLLDQTIPVHVIHTYVKLSQAAAGYYSVVIARLHVDPARRQAQQEWIDGVRAVEQADEQLSNTTKNIDLPVRPAARRTIQSALTTYRHANFEIAHADALLGVHESRPTVQFAAKVSYQG